MDNPYRSCKLTRVLGPQGMFPHGDQVFMIDDADGFVFVTLDPVDISAMASPTVSIWTHIDSTGYEDSDVLRVWVDCADGSTIVVVSGVLDDESHPVGASGLRQSENMWIQHAVPLTEGCASATLSFGVQSNSNSEEGWFDLIEFYEGEAAPSNPGLVISSVVDLTVPEGGSSGKGIQLTAIADVPDLSIYAVGVANNGGGTDGMEIDSLPAISLAQGETYWIIRDPSAYAAYFGADTVFATGTDGPDYHVHNSVALNGDDAVELFMNGVIVDMFGDPNVDGTGTAWEYKDSFVTRNAGSPPGDVFDQSQWTVALFGEAGFVAGEAGDECSDGSTNNCDSACGPHPSFPC